MWRGIIECFLSWSSRVVLSKKSEYPPLTGEAPSMRIIFGPDVENYEDSGRNDERDAILGTFARSSWQENPGASSGAPEGASRRR